MATKRTDSAQDIYQIKVTLLGTKPPIWRRLVVPASISLVKLHDVLQTAMGWHDCHMHQFCAGDRLIGKPDPEDFAMGMPPVENERTIKLSSVLRRPGAKMIYTYDFRRQLGARRGPREATASSAGYERSNLHRWPPRMSARRLRRHPRVL